MGSRGQSYKRQLAQLDRASEKYWKLQEENDHIYKVGDKFYNSQTGQEESREDAEKGAAELIAARERFEDLRDKVIERENRNNAGKQPEQFETVDENDTLFTTSDQSAPKTSAEKAIERNIERKIQNVKDRMEKIAQNSNPGAGMPQSYYNAKAELDRLREEQRKMNAARVKKQQRSSSTRKVNGYGEATTREITSSTYKRAQRRLEQDVANFMGRR